MRKQRYGLEFGSILTPNFVIILKSFEAGDVKDDSLLSMSVNIEEVEEKRERKC